MHTQYDETVKRGSKRKRMTRVISLDHVIRADNRFVGAFSLAISDPRWIVRQFRWSLFGLPRTDLIILHWPDDLFVARGWRGQVKSIAKLAGLMTAKLLWGAKLVWVAHNAVPHDSGTQTSICRSWFLRSLDGVVFISQHSRSVVEEMYPSIREVPSLSVVHGHYRTTAATRETPYVRSGEDIRLVQFGRIRPYKNIETLVDTVSSLQSGFHLLVAGMTCDLSLCAAIEERSQKTSNVKVDIRSSPIADAELEAIVDSADAVVLPYRNILNSGSALFSLSRNRPVLAPNIGALPELRDTVGDEWVYLYDGDFCKETLLNFREWLLHTRRAPSAPLEAYDWDGIGSKLRAFVVALGA
jgi:beta-1,4-mannosyltransferase